MKPNSQFLNENLKRMWTGGDNYTYTRSTRWEVPLEEFLEIYEPVYHTQPTHVDWEDTMETMRQCLPCELTIQDLISSYSKTGRFEEPVEVDYLEDEGQALLRNGMHRVAASVRMGVKTIPISHAKSSDSTAYTTWRTRLLVSPSKPEDCQDVEIFRSMYLGEGSRWAESKWSSLKGNEYRLYWHSLSEEDIPYLHAAILRRAEQVGMEVVKLKTKLSKQPF